MAEEIVRIIKVDTKNSDKSINDLRKEIKGLRSELDKAVVGSEEFESTLKQLTQTQKTYNNLQQQIKDMSRTNQQDMVRFASFARNLGKAYSSLNAAIGLFANGNEDVQKAMLKVQRTIQLVQGLDGIAGLVRDLPKIANLFKGWLSFLNPIEKQVDRIAKGINGIDPKKAKLINEANINAAKVPQTTTTAAAAGGGQQQYLPAQTEELKKQATTYYPALLEQERNLQKARKVALSQLEAQRKEQTKAAKDLSVVSTNYDKIVKAIAEVKSVGFEGEAAFNLLNKKLKEANVNFEVADSNWQSLVNQLAEARNNFGNVSKQVEISTANIADLDKQIALVQKDIVTAEAGMTKFQKVLARTGVVGRTAFNMLKTAIASVGIGLLIAGVTAAVSALGKYIKNLQSAAKEQRKFNKEVSELTNKTAAKSIVVLKELSYAYQKLGDDAEAKEKFLEQYADKIKETGIAVTDVKKAEDVFINNTSNYVNAIMARAKAQAVEQKAIEIYQEYLDKRYDMEQKLAAAGKDLMQGYKPNYGLPMGAGMNTAVEESIGFVDPMIRKRFENIREELGKLDDETEERLRKMFEDVAMLEKEYLGFFATVTTTSGGTEIAEEFDKVSEKIQQLIEYYKQAEEILNDPNYELEEKYAQELDWTRKYYDAQIELVKDNAEAVYKLEAERDRKLADLRNKFNNETRYNDYSKEVQAIEEKYAEQIDLAKEYNQDTIQLEEARERELAALRRKYNDDILESEENRINNEITLLQSQIERIRKMNDTSNLKEPKEQKYQTVYQQPVITTALGIGAGWKNVYQSGKDVKEQYEAQIEYNNKLYELTKNRIEQENELLKQQLQIEGLSADQRLEIERTLTENQIALSDARQQNEEANLQAYLEAQEKRRQALNGILDVTSTMTGALANIARLEAQTAEEGSKKQKNATKAYKALAITQAIVDTYKGANEAYTAMASIPYVGPALGIAAAAAAIVSGLANVRAIQRESISSTTTGASSSSVSAPPALQTPPIEYTRELVGDKELDKLNDPIKCYVLEAEIRSVADKVRVTEQNASF